MKKIFTKLKRDWKKICAHILIVSLVIGLCPSGLTTEKVNISNEETSKEQEEAKNEGYFSGYVNKHNGFEVKIVDNNTVENLVKNQKDKYKLQLV